MLCTLYHDVKRTTSMLLLCDHSIYLVSAPPTTNLYTRSKKYQHRRYINIVKVMHLVEIKLYNQ
jgi:hypothetical protein